MKSISAFASILAATIFLAWTASPVWAGPATLKKLDKRDLRTPETQNDRRSPKPRLRQPDLTVRLLKVTPSSPTTADKIKFEAMIYNDSNVPCPPTKAAIKVGGETNPMLRNVPKLSPHSSWGIARFENLDRALRYRATVTADWKDDVQESDEANNKEYKHFKVTTALPDLAVERMTLQDNCAVRLVLRNLGPGPLPDAAYASPAPNGVALQMFTDNDPFGFMLLTVADPNRRLQQPGGRLEMVWFDNNYVPAGTHQVKLNVDYGNSLMEANEGNNVKTVQMTCQ